jgi:hypothetical protein
MTITIGSPQHRALVRRHVELMQQQQHDGALLPSQEWQRREIVQQLEAIGHVDFGEMADDYVTVMEWVNWNTVLD